MQEMTFNQWARAFIQECQSAGMDSSNYISTSVCPHDEKHGQVCVMVEFRQRHTLQGVVMLTILQRVGMQHSIWFNPNGFTVELHPVNSFIVLD